MTRFHKTYEQFDPDLLSTTFEFFESGPWKGSRGDRRLLFQKWWDAACSAAGFDTAYVVHVASAADLFSVPPGCTEVVRLGALTVLELFHQFRHEQQIREGIDPHTPEACTDAHAFSCSLYFRCRPDTFRKSVAKGLIPGVSEMDMVEMDDVGCALSIDQRSVFDDLADDLLDEFEDDPEVRALLDQFNGGAE